MVGSVSADTLIGQQALVRIALALRMVLQRVREGIALAVAARNYEAGQGEALRYADLDRRGLAKRGRQATLLAAGEQIR